LLWKSHATKNNFADKRRRQIDERLNPLDHSAMSSELRDHPLVYTSQS